MAQRPPKIPNQISTIPPNPLPPTFSSPPLPTMSSSFNSTSLSDELPESSWFDEYDDSYAKCCTHRRAISDILTLLNQDDPEAEADFEHIDHDQLIMSFLSDNPEPPLTPIPDQQSICEADKECTTNAPSGAYQSEDQGASSNAETPLIEVAVKAAVPSSPANTPQQVVDPKRIKRILANRQSAQRSRVRKLKYTADLEQNVSKLEADIGKLKPQLACLDERRSALIAANSLLKQHIATSAQEMNFKDAQANALRKEMLRLRKKYYQQTMTAVNGDMTPNFSEVKRDSGFAYQMSNGPTTVNGDMAPNFSADIDHHHHRRTNF